MVLLIAVVAAPWRAPPWNCMVTGVEAGAWTDAANITSGLAWGKVPFWFGLARNTWFMKPWHGDAPVFAVEATAVA